MYYAHYNEDGTYIGFYLEEIHGSNIPTPNIALSVQEWSEALIGDYRVVDGVHTFSPIIISQEQQIATALQRVRSQRNELIAACDWTQLTDAPLTTSKKTEWKAYRQQLREITNSSDILNVEFPTPPL